MRTFFRQFCAPLAVVAWSAAFALAADPPPLPRDVQAAPSVIGGPAGPVDHVRSDAPLEVPGLPPLPPPLKGESCHFAEAAHEEPACGRWGGVFADVEYLYLKPYRRGLDFGIVSPNRNGDPEGSIQSDPWHSHSAFRVGAGYRLPEDGWEVGFFYTYLHDNEGGVLNRPANGLLFATQTHPGTVEFANSPAADAARQFQRAVAAMSRMHLLAAPATQLFVQRVRVLQIPRVELQMNDGFERWVHDRSALLLLDPWGGPDSSLYRASPRRRV